MNNVAQKSKTKIICGTIVAFAAWFSIIFQFYLAKESFINVLSYFTILCNLLIASSLTFSLFLPKTKIGTYCSSASTQTAIALYIFIVALVYNTVLRGIWTVEGWQLLIDNMLHVVIPILYLSYWFLFTAKDKLNWKNGIYWLVFPALYLIYSLVRGSILKWYPYPFLNVDKHGYDKVMANIGMMLLLFVIAGAVLIAINNKIVKK